MPHGSYATSNSWGGKNNSLLGRPPLFLPSANVFFYCKISSLLSDYYYTIIMSVFWWKEPTAIWSCFCVPFRIDDPENVTSGSWTIHGSNEKVWFIHHYPLVNIQKNYGKSPFFMGKSTINGPCSIAMLNYQRVISVKPIVTTNFYTWWSNLTCIIMCSIQTIPNIPNSSLFPNMVAGLFPNNTSYHLFSNNK